MIWTYEKTQILNNDQKEKPLRIIYKIHMLQNPWNLVLLIYFLIKIESLNSS
jgi:hypothetical protein